MIFKATIQYFVSQVAIGGKNISLYAKNRCIFKSFNLNIFKENPAFLNKIISNVLNKQ